MASFLAPLLLTDLPTPFYRVIPVNFPEEEIRGKTVNLPTCGGGYIYADFNTFHQLSLRNRFILWRYIDKSLELVEYSTDYNLDSNAIRLSFANCHLIGHVSIFEHSGSSQVHIVIPTSTRIIHLTLPHPLSLPTPSIFTTDTAQYSLTSLLHYVTQLIINDPTASFIVPQASFSTPVVSFAAELLETSIVCVLATAGGILHVIYFPEKSRVGGTIVSYEIKQTGLISRIWNGIIPSSIRRSDSGAIESAICGILIRRYENQTYLLQLSKDCKIKIVNLDRKEYIGTEDISEYLPDRNLTPTGSSIDPIIRANSNFDNNIYKIAIVITLQTKAIFLLFDIQLLNALLVFQHTATKFSDLPRDGYHIMDLLYDDSQLFALWITPDNTTKAEICNLASANLSLEAWNSCLPVPSLIPELEVLPMINVQEMYLATIFHSRNVNIESISKALQIYNFKPTQNATLSELKFATIQVVESDMHQMASLPQYEHQPRRELLIEAWSKFYQSCLQYHELSNYPLGLLASKGLFILIGKNSVTQYRPLSIAEEFYYYPEISQCSTKLNGIIDDNKLDQVASVFKMANELRSCFKDLTIYLNELLENDPDLVGFCGYLLDCLDIANEAVCQTDTQIFLNNIENAIAKLDDDPISCLQIVLDIVLLPLSPVIYSNVAVTDTKTSIFAVEHLFSSEFGVSLLSSHLRDTVGKRTEIIFSLILFICYLMKYPLEQQIKSIQKLQSLIIPQFINSLITCHLIANFNSFETSNLDTNSLTSSKGSAVRKELGNKSVLLHYTTSARLAYIHTHLLSRGFIPLNENGEVPDSLCCVQALLPHFMTAILELFTIPGELLNFLAHLFDHAYLPQLQYSVHLLEAQHNINIDYALRYYKAQNYLLTAQYDKSLHYFLLTVAGLMQATPDSFLENLVVERVQDTTSGDKVNAYLMHLIGLFEEHRVPHVVIQLATHALEISTNKDDVNTATLWSIRFKHCLDIGRYKEAYTAMLDNPEHQRKKDCLKRFVIHLCDKKLYKLLCSFSYANMEKEIEDVLGSRARSLEITPNNNYYDLLYSFYIHRGNYRRAANIMYECSVRLSGECSTIESLQLQAKCYLATINTLHLVRKECAWIVKPVKLDPDTKKRKRDINETGDEAVEQEISPTTRAKPLSLADIEVEYMIILARLKLHQIEQSSSPMTTLNCADEELIGLLLQIGLFDSALSISQALKLSLSPIFEALTGRCVKMTRISSLFPKDSENFLAYTRWLDYNDTIVSTTCDDATPEDQIWNLLKHYLNTIPHKKRTEAYLCVAERLLSLDFRLPLWIKESLTKLSPSKLLHLYLCYRYFEEAGHYAIAYIRAVLGNNVEGFAILSNLAYYDYDITAPICNVWLPYNYLDYLMARLKEAPEESHLSQLYGALDALLLDYKNQAKTISNNIALRFAHSVSK